MNALSPIARPITDIARDMGSAVARMVAIQMEAYPEHWTEQERRSAAERELGFFGPGRTPTAQDNPAVGREGE